MVFTYFWFLRTDFTEPTAHTHGAVELGEYEKQRQARMEANQDMLMQLGLA